jgi:HK97 family phage major capsid protein
MKIKTKSQLLSFLKEKCAYNGAGTEEDVLAFCESEKIAVDAEDIKSLFAKTVTIEIEAYEPDVEVAKSAPVSAPGADEEDVAVAKSVTVNTEKKARLAKANFAAVSGKRSEFVAARKAYNAKAAKSEARFGDADAMEQFNAAFRLECSELYPGLRKYAQKSADLDIVGKDGSDTVLTLGGALLADSYKPEVIYRTEEWGVSRYLANNQEMVGNNTSFPAKTAGLSFQPLSSGAVQSTDMSWNLVTLVPKAGGSITLTPMSLFEQSAVNVGDEIANSILQAYWENLDDCYFLGDASAAKFNITGIKNAIPSGAALTSTSTTIGAAVAGDYLNCIGRVENVNSGRLTWVMSRQMFVQGPLRIAMATSGTSVGDVLTRGNTYLNPQTQNSFGGQPHAYLFGYPVYFCQRLPTVGTTGVTHAYFGDFMGGSMIGHRRSLEIVNDNSYAFNKRAVATRGYAEFAVNIHGDMKATASTYGPIVSLSTN